MHAIALTTALDERETVATRTATAIAIASGTKLVTVHASTGAAPPSTPPDPAALAQRWGHTITAEHVEHACCDDVVDTLLDALRRVAPDLVVAATHQRHGVAQLLAGSVAEALARNNAVPTLVIPLEGRGLVDERGVVRLERILVAAGDDASTHESLLAVEWLVHALGTPCVEVVLVHVEDGSPPPNLDGAPKQLRITRRGVPGPITDAIVRAATELDACLIAMATRGHDGLFDALLGSRTERVLRAVACPVLVVPLGARDR